MPETCTNFLSLADAQTQLDSWRKDYNQQRPDGSFGYLTASEFSAHHQEQRTTEAA